MADPIPTYQNPQAPLGQRVRDLISRMTLEEKIGLMSSKQQSIPRLGVGEFHLGGEGAHGLVIRDEPTTVFPQTIGLSCSWNVELLRAVGSVVGDEAREYYQRRGGVTGLNLWAPTIDMERDPRWGRTEESYGEDPFLTGSLSVGYIRGLQGDHPFYLKTVPSTKHFYANNNEEGRGSCSASIDPRNKREYYLKAFEPAFREAKAHSLMTAYNAVNGIPAMLHPDVLNILKGEWELDGFVVCDGGALGLLGSEHRAYTDAAEGVALAIKAGIDNLSDETPFVQNAIGQAVERGILLEADLDRAIANVFGMRFRLGQFDPPELVPYSRIPLGVHWSPAHRELALQAAQESIVLLQNRGKGIGLPLVEKSLKSLAVIGPMADSAYRGWYSGTAAYQVTPLQALVSRLGSERVAFADGGDVVGFQAPDGRWLGCASWFDAALVANRPPQGVGEEFLRTDWGWGNQTFKSLASSKYLSSRDDGLSTSADEVWGWFVRERFDVRAGADGLTTMHDWRGLPVEMDENGTMVVRPKEFQRPEDSAPSSVKISVLRQGTSDAARAASKADAAVVFVGNHPMLNARECFDRSDLALPPAQEALIEAVVAANPLTIVVIVGGYPFSLGSWKDRVAAIVYAPHGGQEAGTAIADVLFGTYNPAGRLSMTWYQSVAQLPDIMDYDIIRSGRTYRYFEGHPLYPFGYGLSYTSFDYQSLGLNAKEIGANDTLKVTVRVKNTGNFPGDEVVQIYASCRGSRVKRPSKQLVGFQRVKTNPGETVEILVVLRTSDLAVWDVTRDSWCWEEGEWELLAASSSADIRLRAVFQVHGEVIPPRDLSVWTRAENFDDQQGVVLERLNQQMSGGPEAGGSCVQRRSADSEELSWIAFAGHRPLNFSRFEARVNRGSDFKAAVSLVQGRGTATVLGRLDLAIGPSWDWQTVSIPVDPSLSANQLFLHLEGSIRIRDFRFV